MFANSTPIADSETSFKPIEEFLDGDEVMVADVSGGGITWRQANVRYSAGTGPDGHQPSMVYITYGGDRVVIVGPDQLFMLPEGRLKRADRLVPVQDDLVDAHGNAVALTDVQIGAYDGGVHHIATSLEPSTQRAFAQFPRGC